MNKSMRVLATTGLVALAGLAVSAGPAQASASTDAKPGAAQTPQYGRDGIAGYFRTLGTCEFAGRVGEHARRWDDHDCRLLQVGFRRGVWELRVDRFGRPVHVPGKPSGVKGDSGYGSKGGVKGDSGYGSKGGAKDNGVKDDATKGNGAKDDGYGGKDNGVKDDAKGY